MSQLSLAVCTLSWNDGHATEQLLRALRFERWIARARGVRYGAVAYDNASVDGTASHLSVAARRGVIDHLIVADHNVGNSVSRNEMIEWALDWGADVIALIDGDVVPTLGALTTFAVELVKAPQTVGSIGADFYPWSQTTKLKQSTPFKLRVNHRRCLVVNSIALTQFGVFRAEMFRAGVRFESEPPFDGPGWGAEDNDLGYQMFHRGYATLLHTGIVYRHLKPGGSIREMSKAGTDPKQIYEARRLRVTEKWRGVPAIERSALNDVALARFPAHKLNDPET